MSLGPTSALPACRPNAACAPCFFGAHTTLHSFPYEIEPLTVEVIPFVTPLPNGSLVTSYSTTTSSETISGGTPTASQITDTSLLTWTICGSIVGTSPTTYVQYTDFYGAPGTSTSTSQPVQTDAPSTCLQWSNVKTIVDPSSANVAPFVVPLSPNAPINNSWPFQQVPLPILDYMETQDWVTTVMGHEDLATCATAPDYYSTQTQEPCTTVFPSTVTLCLPTGNSTVSGCATQTIVTTITSTLHDSTSGFPGPPPGSSDRSFTSSPAASFSTFPTIPTMTPPPYPSGLPSDSSASIAQSSATLRTAHLLTTITGTPRTVPFFTPWVQSDSPSVLPISGSAVGGQGSGTIASPSQDAGTPPEQDPGSQGSQLPDQLPPSGSTPPDGTQTTSEPPPGVIPSGGSQATLEPSSGGQELIGGTQTISAGGVATFAGKTLSLASSSDGTVFINGKPTSISGSILTIGGAILTLVSQGPSVTQGIGGLADASQTILPGQAVTTDGATISLPNPAKTVYVNGQPTSVTGLTVTVGTNVFTVVSMTKIVTATSNTDGTNIFRASTSATKSSASKASITPYVLCCWLVLILLLM